jgi:hypothetical protein
MQHTVTYNTSLLGGCVDITSGLSIFFLEIH